MAKATTKKGARPKAAKTRTAEPPEAIPSDNPAPVAKTAAPAARTTAPAARPAAAGAARTSGGDAKDALQRAIERQSQLQLMIKTSGSARLWAENMRRLKIVILFVWFGFWGFIDSFLSIGHRVSHLLHLPHRSASHDVIVIEGALAEGLVSAGIGVAIGYAILKGFDRINIDHAAANRVNRNNRN